MSKISNTPRYRIKGLPDVHACESHESEIKQTKTLTTLSSMDRVLNAMPRPHLSDYLHAFLGLDNLALLWPTFSFLQPRSGAKPIKSLPMHLASFLDEEPTDEDYLPNLILKEDKRQEDEKSAILHLLKVHEEGLEPDVTEQPLAMSLACHLFAGSSWVRSNQMKIKDLILTDPVATYVALATGVYGNDSLSLILGLRDNPDLILELSRSPHFAKAVGESWFKKELEKYPLHLACWLHLSGETKAAYDLLRSSARKDPLSAGVCLGLDPHHADAAKWRRWTWETTEAIYWAGRIWMTASDDITKFPYSGPACTRLVDDPQWYYHWLRDCESHDLVDKLFLIWPDLWCVEFMLDQNFPISSFFDLNNRRELSCEDPIETGITLWLADYAQHTNED